MKLFFFENSIVTTVLGGIKRVSCAVIYYVRKSVFLGSEIKKSARPWCAT